MQVASWLGSATEQAVEAHLGGTWLGAWPDLGASPLSSSTPDFRRDIQVGCNVVDPRAPVEKGFWTKDSRSLVWRHRVDAGSALCRRMRGVIRLKNGEKAAGLWLDRECVLCTSLYTSCIEGTRR